MRRISRKQTKAGGDQAQSSVDEIPQRIFLYLQPKTICYRIEDEDVTVEIELTHPKCTLTTLSDHYTTKNIIHLDEFNAEKPTFSITIHQDDIADVTNLSDTPLTLTLYENIPQPPSLMNESGSASGNVVLTTKTAEESIEEEQDQPMIIERRPVAQGYIDLLEFFTKTRSRSSSTVFLYPLPTSSHRLTCKMEWEIYSLHPLMKQLNFSNVIFLTFGSLYNVDEELMNDCDDVTARLSFLSTIPHENEQFHKVPICEYTVFSKELIRDQALHHKWENLKNKQVGNEHSMSIMTESKVNIHKVFHDLLRTENMDLNVEDIDEASESALVCNSLHRYILTDHMENALEDALARNEYRIVIELMREKEPEVVLLQGFIDLSVLMFPQVSNCNFAIEMRPPGYKKPTIPTPKDHTPRNTKNKKGKRKSSAPLTTDPTRRSTADVEEVKKEKIPFAIVRICLDKPITEPRQDMIRIPKSLVKYQKFSKCPHTRAQYGIDVNLDDICDEIYRDFDESILGIVNNMLRNNIKSIEDNRQFYCSKLGNMTNKIMRLVACDFNVCQPTETNIEFTNLMTVVYQKLMERIYNRLIKCSPMNDIEHCIDAKDDIEKTIITRLNIAKYMFEVGNLEMSHFMVEKLLSEYLDNAMLSFYLFLFDVEREDFEAAKVYLEKPLKEKHPEGQLFMSMVTIYITYKQELKDTDCFGQAEENLIKSLTTFCENNPKNIFDWILLYCLYKKHHYLPGMEFCRWKYENLYNQPMFDMQPMPKSRWDIYMAHKINFKSVKAQNYYKVVNLFLSLGLYQFAEWIYDDIATEAMDVEKYFMTNTFKIFLNKVEKKFGTKNFAVEKFVNPLYLRATLSQVNGNLEFVRNIESRAAAIKQYALLCDINDLESYDPFSLGLLRYSYYMMEEKEYSKAKEAFALCCCSEDGNSVIAAIGKGKACYRLGELDEAEMSLAESTRNGIHMPNVWAFLALINLRKGENYKALECWKYARLNSKDSIHVEILDELDKINHSDVSLYVDIPDRNKI